MKSTKWRIGFCLVAVSFLFSCGGGGDGASSSACNAFRVLNGDECSSESLPVVQLVINGQGGCTGTIISNDDVLTAAHCVVNAQSVTAVHDRGSQNAVSSVYNALADLSGAFDVGLLKFPNIATNMNVEPARFNLSVPVVVGDAIKLVGYGQDGTPALANNNPRGAELSVTDAVNGEIVVFFDERSRGACFGDSGAAITRDGLIVGTVSGGVNLLEPGSCARGTVNIFTNLQIQGNANFLRAYAPNAIFE